MKKVVTIAVLGAVAIVGLLVISNLVKQKPDPLDKPIAEWLRKEVMPKMEARQRYSDFCISQLGNEVTDKSVKMCYDLAEEQYPSVAFEQYIPKDKE